MEAGANLARMMQMPSLPQVALLRQRDQIKGKASHAQLSR